MPKPLLLAPLLSLLAFSPVSATDLLWEFSKEELLERLDWAPEVSVDGDSVRCRGTLTNHGDRPVVVHARLDLVPDGREVSLDCVPKVAPPPPPLPLDVSALLQCGPRDRSVPSRPVFELTRNSLPVLEPGESRELVAATPRLNEPYHCGFWKYEPRLLLSRVEADTGQLARHATALVVTEPLRVAID